MSELTLHQDYIPRTEYKPLFAPLPETMDINPNFIAHPPA